MSKYYKLLGRLPDDVIYTLKSKLLPLVDTEIDSVYQRLEFSAELHDYFLSIFENTELKIQKDITGTRWIQKAFYTNPGLIYPIHRDGIRCMSALNIAIQTNADDWTRWYSDEIIESHSTVAQLGNTLGLKTRNSNITDIESVPFVEEFKPKVGDVYVLDVNTFHTWNCAGPDHRIIIQTKFDRFPDFNTIAKSLTVKSFGCIQPV